MNPETKLSKAIADALRIRGHEVIRVQTGRVLVSRGKFKHWMHLAPEGTPDLCLPFVPGWLEVKLPERIGPAKGRKGGVRKRAPSELNADQDRWHARARDAGVRVAVVRSVGEALSVVNAWREEVQHERAMGWR